MLRPSKNFETKFYSPPTWTDQKGHSDSYKIFRLQLLASHSFTRPGCHSLSSSPCVTLGTVSVPLALPPVNLLFFFWHHFSYNALAQKPSWAPLTGMHSSETALDFDIWSPDLLFMNIPLLALLWLLLTLLPNKNNHSSSKQLVHPYIVRLWARELLPLWLIFKTHSLPCHIITTQ